MPFSQPSFPDFTGGDRLTSKTVNKLIDGIQAASINNPTGGGLNSSNSSSGNSVSLPENIARPPIWAQIISINRNSAPRSGSGSVSGIGGASTCPDYVYAYGWVELIEDVNIGRSKSEFFFVNPVESSSGSATSATGGVINNSTKADQAILQCRDINGLNTSVGGMLGTPDNFPAYEVNNQVVALGTIVKLYFGNGSYMLFNNTGGSASGTSSNYIDVITNVCPIFEEVEPTIGVTLINTTGGIKGGPITSSGTIQLSASGAKAGSYVNPAIVIDTYGRITQAINGNDLISNLQTDLTQVGNTLTGLQNQINALGAALVTVNNQVAALALRVSALE